MFAHTLKCPILPDFTDSLKVREKEGGGPERGRGSEEEKDQKQRQ